MSKTIFITGSTDGIGKLAAMQLAQNGHQLVLHGRKQDKLEATIKEAKKLAGHEKIKGYLADLSDFNAIRHMAKKMNEELPKLDVLINNAGVYHSSEANNAQGLDMRIAVNYYAPYLLSRALLPLLKNSGEARIINLSSAAQSSVTQKLLVGEASLTPNESYAQSKLALTMWSFALAYELQNINVIAVNPGSLLNTKMVKEAFGRSWSPADKGASILCELAVDKNYEGITAKYYDNDQGGFGNAHPDVYDEQKIEALLHATRQVVDEES